MNTVRQNKYTDNPRELPQSDTTWSKRGTKLNVFMTKWHIITKYKHFVFLSCYPEIVKVGGHMGAVC